MIGSSNDLFPWEHFESTHLALTRGISKRQVPYLGVLCILNRDVAQLVARTAGGGEAAGSSPVIPTMAVPSMQRNNFDLHACISGSFGKFKPEIDQLIDDFADLGVEVLEPTKGYIARLHPLAAPYGSGIYPLPDERGMHERDIEKRFIAALRRADFLFLYNKEGYIGTSAGLEFGFADAWQKPIYALEAEIPLELVDYDLSTKAYIESRIRVLSLGVLVAIEREKKNGSVVS